MCLHQSTLRWISRWVSGQLRCWQPLPISLLLDRCQQWVPVRLQSISVFTGEQTRTGTCKLPQTRTLQGEHCCRRFAFLENSFDTQCLSFSNNSSLFTIHASKSGSPLFTSTLRALTEWFTKWFVEKGKRPNILMRNSLKDEKLLQKNYLHWRELSPGLRFLYLKFSLRFNCSLKTEF